MSKRLDRKDRKRREAEQRNAAWAELSTEQKLAELAKRPGLSARQIARLTAEVSHE